MHTRLLILILSLITTSVLAQDDSKQVTGSAGMPISNSSNTISYRRGEALTDLIQVNLTIYQGFWATLINDETMSVTESSSVTNEISCLPNPVVNNI